MAGTRREHEFPPLSAYTTPSHPQTKMVNTSDFFYIASMSPLEMAEGVFKRGMKYPVEKLLHSFR